MIQSVSLQDIYTKSSDPVRTAGISLDTAKIIYRDYTDFVEFVCPSLCDLLDVGCGNGWSTYLFSQMGHKATGIDLNETAFEPPSHKKLQLKRGSALEIPFPTHSFDVVCTFQMLEHIPDPQLALSEMARVLRPGGTLIIVSPNINSIIQPLRGLFYYVWRNRPLYRILYRDEGVPRHPFGNTFPECFGSFVMNVLRTSYRLLPTSAWFEMRQPDVKPPFYADNDSCYRCNPYDLMKFLKFHHFTIKCSTKPGRPAILTPLAAGTWIAAIKPA